MCINKKIPFCQEWDFILKIEKSTLDYPKAALLNPIKIIPKYSDIFKPGLDVQFLKNNIKAFGFKKGNRFL